MKIVLMALTYVLCVAAQLAHAESAQWREAARYKLGGSGGWDLMTVDASARRLYVTRGDHVMVVDVDHGTLAGDLPGFQRAHGVAIVPKHHRGYVSSGGDNEVVAFDTTTLAIIGKIAVDKNPDAILYDPKSDRVLAFNGGSNTVSLIDPANDSVSATIALPGKPELAVGNGTGSVFVNLEDVAKVARLDVAAHRVASVWALPECEDPSGIALDSVNGRVFSVCRNRHMIVTDARTGRHVATVAIGSGPDGAAFDPASRDAFSPNSDGTLTVVHELDKNHFAVEQTLSTPPRSRCITFDEGTHRAILATAAFGPVTDPKDAHARPPMMPDSFGLLVVGKD